MMCVNKVKNVLKKIIGIYDYDREGERLIKKSILLYDRGGKVNIIRAKRIYNKVCKNFSCSFPPYVHYGEEMYIAHAHGIQIGRTASIGDRCKIYPFCGIIAAVKGDDKRWNEKQRRHAVIGNDCILGYGSLIIGPITIGDDVTVAAGAIVTKDIPSHVVVKGINECRTKREDEILERYKPKS